MHIAGDSDFLIGLTPHVTQNGFCSDGCFRFGKQNIQDGGFVGSRGRPRWRVALKAAMSYMPFRYDCRSILYPGFIWSQFYGFV